MAKKRPSPSTETTWAPCGVEQALERMISDGDGGGDGGGDDGDGGDDDDDDDV